MNIFGFEKAEVVIRDRINRITKTRVSIYKIANVLPYLVVCEHGRNGTYETKKSAIDAAACPHWCDRCWGKRSKEYLKT